MENKQTAIEFIEQVILKPIQNKLPKEALQALKIAFDNAKEIEREQMSEVYTEGFKRKAYILELMKPVSEWNEKVPENFDTYYEKTYGL
jgi:hypothetical protein